MGADRCQIGGQPVAAALRGALVAEILVGDQSAVVRLGEAEDALVPRRVVPARAVRDQAARGVRVRGYRVGGSDKTAPDRRGRGRWV